MSSWAGFPWPEENLLRIKTISRTGKRLERATESRVVNGSSPTAAIHNEWSKTMNRKRAELNFKCPACQQTLQRIGPDYGCTNDSCWENYWHSAYRLKLKKMLKK
jgi:hypothetical protein